jgi:DNA-binding response OmpR family regulator
MADMRKKILLVEDDMDIAFMVRSRLEADGYEVHVVHTGEAGLEKIKEAPPDLVVLDVILPGKNGYEVCACIKEDKSLSLPVVMLTSNQRHVDEKRGYLVKADAYIRKPMSNQLLLPEIKRLLSFKVIP